MRHNRISVRLTETIENVNKVSNTYVRSKLIMAVETQKFISLSNLATRWDRSRQTLWREIQENKIPSKKLGNLHYVYMDWVLEKEARTVEPEAK